MREHKLLLTTTVVALCIASIMFVYLVYSSKALSYLSHDPRACINCHVMNTQFATWQHSSHAETATCVDCHLPRGNLIAKYIAKSDDGWRHSVAFTLNTYNHTITISDRGAKRVQDNCISCHSSTVANIIANSQHYDAFDDPNVLTGRTCWSCHEGVAHGSVRGLTAAPNPLGIQDQSPNH